MSCFFVGLGPGPGAAAAVAVAVAVAVVVVVVVVVVAVVVVLFWKVIKTCSYLQENSITRSLSYSSTLVFMPLPFIQI